MTETTGTPVESIRKALLGYRITAWITGIWLIALCYEMGRFGAEVNLPTLYRIFYRFGTPLFVLKKASRLWDVHYDSGRLDADQTGDNAVMLTIVEFERPHRAHCLSVLGWATRSIELSGAELTRGEETRCRTRGDSSCTLELAWR